MQTADVLLTDARRQLKAAGHAETAALDARLLLQHASGLSHEQLIANPTALISTEVERRFQAVLDRRLLHEPVSRIVGEREFYGRTFLVTPAVLDPRPDTETVVELCLGLLLPGAPAQVLDLGTGSGVIALTLLAERPQSTAVAVDLSAQALDVARENARALGVDGRCRFVESAWLAGVEGSFDLIVSNPPYIPAGAIAALADDVRGYDPRLALDGGADGLAPYSAICAAAGAHLKPGGALVFEIGAGQAAAVTAIAVAAGWRPVLQAQDLGGHVRGLAFRFG